LVTTNGERYANLHHSAVIDRRYRGKERWSKDGRRNEGGLEGAAPQRKNQHWISTDPLSQATLAKASAAMGYGGQARRADGGTT